MLFPTSNPSTQLDCPSISPPAHESRSKWVHESTSPSYGAPAWPSCCWLNLHWNARLEVIRKFDFNLFSFRIRWRDSIRLSFPRTCVGVECGCLSLFTRPVCITNWVTRRHRLEWQAIIISIPISIPIPISISNPGDRRAEVWHIAPFARPAVSTFPQFPRKATRLSIDLFVPRVLVNFCLILCAFNSFNQIIAHVLNVNIFVRFH